MNSYLLGALPLHFIIKPQNKQRDNDNDFIIKRTYLDIRLLNTHYCFFFSTPPIHDYYYKKRRRDVNLVLHLHSDSVARFQLLRSIILFAQLVLDQSKNNNFVAKTKIAKTV